MIPHLYAYIIVMAVVTYLIRVLPITLIRTHIQNKTIRSFLYYIPYVALGAMTVPAVFTATNSLISGVAGFVTALILALRKKSLIVVAAGACLAVFLVELIPNLPV